MTEVTTTKPDASSPSPPSTPGTGYLKQEYLVGEHVYLRPIEKSDASRTVSIRDTVYPLSPQRTEEWLKEEISESKPWNLQVFVIIRKADDVIVGSLFSDRDGGVATSLRVRVDPLLGEPGQQLRAEAIELFRQYIVEERQVATVLLFVPETDTIVIDRLKEAGWIETARHREMRIVEGRRVDQVLLQAFNSRWLETLGNPMDIPLERTGTGLARPVPPPVGPLPNPPKNALLVGKRVYLRAHSGEDAAKEVAWARKETETFFDIGRHLPSVPGMTHWLDGLEKKEIPDFLMIGVYLRENDLYIGDVMLIGLNLVNMTAETGSFFHRGDYRGSGYGSEAKHLLLEYAFDVLGLHMVESWVLFPNTRSAAALRKQGYREAGRMCWAYPYEGGFNNGVLFDLLAEEWRAMPRQDWE